MDAIVFLWAYSFCYKPIENHNEYKWILIDNVNHKKMEEIPQGIFEEIYFVNLDDFHEVEYVMDNVTKKYNIKAILTAYESSVELAGHLRTKYNIQGLKEEKAVSVRNKYVMKSILNRKNIKTAKFSKVSNEIDIYKFINKVGFPIVIKPIDGFGTARTYKIENKTILEEFLRSNKCYPLLVEEYIKGREFHCDSIVIKGNIEFSSVGEYLHPLIQTIGNKKLIGSIVYPSSGIEPSFITKIKEMNKEVINVLEIKDSICHSEFFITEYGEAVFSEIAVRIGGGPVICPCIKNTHGVDLFKAFIDVELGVYNKEDYRKSGPYTGFVSFPSYNGIVTKISKYEDFKDIDGLKNVSILYKVGQSIGDLDNTAVRSGAAIIEDYNLDCLKEKMNNIYERFVLETK